jgi:polyhydroxyalkanoate synthesis regulator phasin
MMEYNPFAKQAVIFQKNLFENTYNIIAKVQDQATEAVDTLMNQTRLVPEEGRQVMKSWIIACREVRDRYKSYVEEGFTGLEKRFSQESETAPIVIATPNN